MEGMFNSYFHKTRLRKHAIQEDEVVRVTYRWLEQRNILKGYEGFIWLTLAFSGISKLRGYDLRDWWRNEIRHSLSRQNRAHRFLRA